MNENGLLGGSGIFFFALIILMMMFGGGGGFGWGGNANVDALNADMQRGFDNQNTMAMTRDILGAVTNGTAQTIAASTANATNAINAIKDGNASLIREFGNVETALTALGGEMQNCCCSTKMLIQQTAADNALQMAQMEARINAKIDANEIQALRDKVGRLELSQATSGVLRFPSTWSYDAGQFPPVFATGV